MIRRNMVAYSNALIVIILHSIHDFVVLQTAQKKKLTKKDAHLPNKQKTVKSYGLLFEITFHWKLMGRSPWCRSKKLCVCVFWYSMFVIWFMMLKPYGSILAPILTSSWEPWASEKSVRSVVNSRKLKVRPLADGVFLRSWPWARFEGVFFADVCDLCYLEAPFFKPVGTIGC